MDADTSTYPKPGPPVNALDTAAKFQGLQQGAQQLQSGNLLISKQKLDLANQSYEYMTRALNSLGPQATKQQLIDMGNNMVNQKLVPPEMVQTMDATIPDDPTKMPAFIDQLQTQTAQHSEMTNYFRGSPVITQNGQQFYSVRQPLSPNQPSTVQDLGIRQQPPPTTPTVDTNETLPNGQPNPNYGQPRMLGNTALPVAPGGVQTLPPASGAPMPNARPGGLPIAPQPGAISPPMMPKPDVSFNAPAGPKDQSRVAAGTSVPGMLPQPTGPATGMPPQFEEGRKQYNSDIELATARQTALKPILQALPLLKQLQTSGPGSNAFNSAVAGLKNFGILPTGVSNDPTAIYQEVEKKLAQYVSSNPVGQRSDAAQALTEAGNPNPNHQIRPALIQLAQDAVALDRLAAARAPSFTQKITNPDGTTTQAPRTDFQNYQTFRAGFPPSIDERAFKLDMMEPKDRTDLLNSMKKQQNTPEGKRFWKSLQTVKDLNLYNISGE